MKSPIIKAYNYVKNGGVRAHYIPVQNILYWKQVGDKGLYKFILTDGTFLHLFWDAPDQLSDINLVGNESD